MARKIVLRLRRNFLSAIPQTLPLPLPRKTKVRLSYFQEASHLPLEQDPTSQQPMAQQQKRQQQTHTPKGAAKWREMLLLIFVLFEITASIGICLHWKNGVIFGREETLANICYQHAQMLEYQFSACMNKFHSLAILVSTYHHGKHPSAIDQVNFQSVLNFLF